MIKPYDRKLVLEDGTEFFGYRFGSAEDKVAELVFNTSAVGYQEIISDPSYTDQTVVMSYPLIGNYGVNADDYETETPSISGLVVREYNDEPSNFRSRETLSEVMEKYGISGISGIDTRRLVRLIRNYGSRRCIICGLETPAETARKIIAGTPVPRDAVSRVSVKEPAVYKSYGDIKIVAVDCGMKMNIVRSLNALGATVEVVPFDYPAEKILAKKPDGLFISNGPGDPADASEVIETVGKLIGKLPIFGICLGHQIIAIAYGAKTYKLKFGHRGGNHPVKNLTTGKIEITSQNHSYSVDEKSLAATPLTVTHRNLLDGTVEGAECKKDKVFCVQYHPESAPGPEDSGYLFNRFIDLIKENENA